MQVKKLRISHFRLAHIHHGPWWWWTWWCSNYRMLYTAASHSAWQEPQELRLTNNPIGYALDFLLNIDWPRRRNYGSRRRGLYQKGIPPHLGWVGGLPWFGKPQGAVPSTPRPLDRRPLQTGLVGVTLTPTPPVPVRMAPDMAMMFSYALKDVCNRRPTSLCL
jgi:hypothetical protein